MLPTPQQQRQNVEPSSTINETNSQIRRRCNMCCLIFQDEASFALHKINYGHKTSKTGRPLKPKRKKINKWWVKLPETIDCKDDRGATTNSNLWNNPWICNKCGLKFRDYRILELHRESACQALQKEPLECEVVESKSFPSRLQEQTDIEEVTESFVIDSNKMKQDKKQREIKNAPNKCNEIPAEVVIDRKIQREDFLRKGVKFCDGCRSYFLKTQLHIHQTFYCEAYNDCEQKKSQENDTIANGDKPAVKSPEKQVETKTGESVCKVKTRNKKKSSATGGDVMKIGDKINSEPVETNKNKPVHKVRCGKTKKPPATEHDNGISSDPEFENNAKTSSSSTAEIQKWVCVKCRLTFSKFISFVQHQETDCKALHLKPKVYQNRRSANSAVRTPSVIVEKSQTTEKPLVDMGDKLKVDTTKLKVEDEEPQIKSESIEDEVVDAFGEVQHEKTDCKAFHLEPKEHQHHRTANCAVRTTSVIVEKSQETVKPLVEIGVTVKLETKIDHIKLAEPFVIASNKLNEHQLRQKVAEEDDQLRRKREKANKRKVETTQMEKSNARKKIIKKTKETPKASAIEKNAQGVILLKNIVIKFCEECRSYFKTTKANLYHECHCKALNEPKSCQAPEANKYVVDNMEKSRFNTDIDLIELDVDETQIKNEPIADDELELATFGEVHRELSQNKPDLKTEVDLEEYSFHSLT